MNGLVCDWIKKGGLFLHFHWFPPKKRREKSEYIKAKQQHMYISTSIW